MALTFKDLKDRAKARLKLSSTEADARVGQFVNERYRAASTSVGLMAVRQGTVTFPTVAGTVEYTPTTLIHALTVVYPAGNRIIIEKTLDFIRNLDPGNLRTGSPQYWVREKVGNTTETLRLWPTPDGPPDYTVQVDGLLQGSDMVADGDTPVFPEDFEDLLIFGACADELLKQEKSQLADEMEGKYRQRLAELRYFIAKTSYLDFRQGERSNWWWGYWWGTYRG